MIVDFGVILAGKIFKGFREEDRMLRRIEYVSLSEGRSVSGIYSIDWTKLIDGIKLPHRKQDCLGCKNELVCSKCAKKRKMNCFNCETERNCKSCLDLITQKKHVSTDNNMLERKSVNEYHQLLPY